MMTNVLGFPSSGITREPATPAVLCRDLTKDFGSGEGRVRVLRGVDFAAQILQIFHYQEAVLFGFVSQQNAQSLE